MRCDLSMGCLGPIKSAEPLFARLRRIIHIGNAKAFRAPPAADSSFRIPDQFQIRLDKSNKIKQIRQIGERQKGRSGIEWRQVEKGSFAFGIRLSFARRKTNGFGCSLSPALHFECSLYSLVSPIRVRGAPPALHK